MGLDATVPDFSQKDRSKLVATITKKATAAIKKSAHNDKKKPYTEISEGLPRCHALALLGSLGTVTADTKKFQKRTLSPEDVESLFGIAEVHPVKFDGKTLCFAGDRPFVYAWAKVESLEVKVEENMTSFKFRTWMSGTGIDAEGKCSKKEGRTREEKAAMNAAWSQEFVA